MSSGFNHDKYNYLWSLPFALICSLSIGWTGFTIGGLSFLVGGLWFSPDLDISSNPSRRWGLLSIIWIPYRKIIVHRSRLSHSVLLGTIGRITYISILLFLIFKSSCYLNLYLMSRSLEIPSSLINNKNNLGLCTFIGLETSACLHLLQDNKK